MWHCKRCDKPVYFAERKQSMGFDWHPECLRCEECGKRLNPGQHADHKGAAYCHVPCYGVLFGPRVFGHGEMSHTFVQAPAAAEEDVADALAVDDVQSSASTNVSGTSSCSTTAASSPLVDDAALCPHHPPAAAAAQATAIVADSADGAAEQPMPEREILERKLHVYNEFYENFRAVIQSRERNGRLILDGVLKLYWGVSKLLQFKEDDDRRPIVRKRVSHYIEPDNMSSGSDSDTMATATTPSLPPHNINNNNNINSDDDGCRGADVGATTRQQQQQQQQQQERERQRRRQTNCQSVVPADDGLAEAALVAGPAAAGGGGASVDSSPTDESTTTEPSVRLPPPPTAGAAAATSSSSKQGRVLRRRPGRRMNKAHIKRRCSINGHFYNRETSVFTPPHGSLLSVWVTSLVTAREMVRLVLDKYRIEDEASSFALYIIWDTGERRRLRETECPLVCRVMIGPSETAARLFIMDTHTSEIRSEVAQYINLSLVECTAILQKYREEEELQVTQIKQKYIDLKDGIRRRMRELKVQL